MLEEGLRCPVQGVDATSQMERAQRARMRTQQGLESRSVPLLSAHRRKVQGRAHPITPLSVQGTETIMSCSANPSAKTTMLFFTFSHGRFIGALSDTSVQSHDADCMVSFGVLSISWRKYYTWPFTVCWPFDNSDRMEWACSRLSGFGLSK